MTHNPAYILFKKEENDAKLPSKNTPSAAGYDLYSYIDCVCKAKESIKVRTGIAARLPENTHGKIEACSKLAWEYKLQTLGTIIDNDFIGEIIVVLKNGSTSDFYIQKYAKIAQLIPILTSFPEVYVVENLPNTVRGTRGLTIDG